MSTDGPLYNSFSTGATAFDLTDVKLLLSGTAGSGLAVVQLFSTVVVGFTPYPTQGSPLSLIGFVHDNNLPTTPAPVDFRLSSPLLLAANTRYWIGLIAYGSTTAGWAYSATNSAGTVGTAGEYWAYNPSGVLTSTPNGAPGTTTSTPYQMQINSTPLPASWTLMIVGLAGIGAALRFSGRRERVVAA